MNLSVQHQRLQQSYAALSPLIPQPVVNIIISYDKCLFDEENTAALNYLAKYVVNRNFSLYSRKQVNDVLVVINKLFESVEAEGLLELSDLAKIPDEIDESGQVELAKRISILHLVKASYLALDRINEMHLVENIIGKAFQVYQKNRPAESKLLNWVEVVHPWMQELNKNNLAQRGRSLGILCIAIRVFVNNHC